MAITTGGTEILGGVPTAYAGGFGGIAPVGLIGLNTLFDRDRDRGVFDTPGTTVLEQNVSDLRKDVADNGKEIHILGNEVAGMFATQNLAITGEFRNLDNQICEVEKTAMQTAHASTIQGMQNTQMLSNQLTAFQVSNDKEFCAIKSQINADGDATRALITQNLIDGLRSELLQERRGRENREIEINVQNNATQTQNVLQAQLQSQNQFLASMFNALGDQVNRAANSVVNVGSGTVAGGQTNNQSATKVNS